MTAPPLKAMQLSALHQSKGRSEMRPKMARVHYRDTTCVVAYSMDVNVDYEAPVPTNEALFSAEGLPL